MGGGQAVDLIYWTNWSCKSRRPRGRLEGETWGRSRVKAIANTQDTDHLEHMQALSKYWKKDSHMGSCWWTGRSQVRILVLSHCHFARPQLGGNPPKETTPWWPLATPLWKWPPKPSRIALTSHWWSRICYMRDYLVEPCAFGNERTAQIPKKKALALLWN